MFSVLLRAWQRHLSQTCFWGLLVGLLLVGSYVYIDLPLLSFLHVFGLLALTAIAIAVLALSAHRYVFERIFRKHPLYITVVVLLAPVIVNGAIWLAIKLRKIEVVGVRGFLWGVAIIALVSIAALFVYTLSHMAVLKSWFRKHQQPVRTINFALITLYFVVTHRIFERYLPGLLPFWYFGLFFSSAMLLWNLLQPFRRQRRCFVVANHVALVLGLLSFFGSLSVPFSKAETHGILRNPYSAQVFQLYRQILRVTPEQSKVGRDGPGGAAEGPLLSSKKEAPLAGKGSCPTEPYNVVFISIEAVRSDHVSFLGYRRDTMASIGAFARKYGIVFENAVSPASGTWIAIPAMLVGSYPSYLRWNMEGKINSLSPQNVTIAEHLRARGYLTGFLLHGWITQFMKQSLQGFQVVRSLAETKKSIRLKKKYPAPVSNRMAMEFLERYKEKNFFLMMTYYDPHRPYNYYRYPEKNFGKTNIDRYDGELAFADKRIGFLLEYLAHQPYWDRTIVVITADHGEEFLEHGKTAHAQQLYRESIFVPLVIRIPGQPPKRIKNNVSLVDIVPTLYELLCVPPAQPLTGVSLMPVIRGEKVLPRYIYSEMINRLKTPPWVIRSVVYDRYHMIHVETTDQWELFDFRNDPLERTNLMVAKPTVAARLKRALARLAQHPADTGF